MFQDAFKMCLVGANNEPQSYYGFRTSLTNSLVITDNGLNLRSVQNTHEMSDSPRVTVLKIKHDPANKAHVFLVTECTFNADVAIDPLESGFYENHLYVAHGKFKPAAFNVPVLPVFSLANVAVPITSSDLKIDQTREWMQGVVLGYYCRADDAEGTYLIGIPALDDDGNKVSQDRDVYAVIGVERRYVSRHAENGLPASLSYDHQRLWLHADKLARTFDVSSQITLDFDYSWLHHNVTFNPTRYSDTLAPFAKVCLSGLVVTFKISEDEPVAIVEIKTEPRYKLTVMDLNVLDDVVAECIAYNHLGVYLGCSFSIGGVTVDQVAGVYAETENGMYVVACDRIFSPISHSYKLPESADPKSITFWRNMAVHKARLRAEAYNAADPYTAFQNLDAQIHNAWLKSITGDVK